MKYLKLFINSIKENKKDNPFDEKNWDDEEIEPKKPSKKGKHIEVFHDEFGYISEITLIGDNVIDVDLSRDRLQKEIDMIEELLNDHEIDYDDIHWDGVILIIESGETITKLSRNELMEYLPDLNIFK